MKSIFKHLYALLLVSLFGYAIYFVFGKMWHAFVVIDSKLAVGIVATFATVIISIASVLIAKHIENKTIIRNENRIKKIPIYTDLIEFIFKIWQLTQSESKVSEEEMNDFMSNFIQKLLIWGSDDVIDIFYKFRQTAFNDNTSNSILFILEEIWLAIRKDLGHKNTNLTKGKLLGLIITDIDQYLKNGQL